MLKFKFNTPFLDALWDTAKKFTSKPNNNYKGGSGGGRIPVTPKPSTPKPKPTPSNPAPTPAPTPSTAPSLELDRYKTEIEKLKQELTDYKRPRPAKEVAELYGLSDYYNEQNILNKYNKSTNEYYDNAIAEQNKLRTNYARNNAQYVNSLADSYIDSYANAAPTATGKGMLAANALSSMLNADQINANNDYGMAQSVNALDESRKAELAGNPELARKYYNQMGAYLANTSTALNTSDVKQYIDSLDAYGKRYAADRAYASYLAQAAQAKYAGLINAGVSKAQGTANRSNWDDLYNYYLVTHGGDAHKADSNIADLLRKNAQT